MSSTEPFTGLPPTGKTPILVLARIDGAEDADQRRRHLLVIHLHRRLPRAQAVEHDAQRGDARLDGGQLLLRGDLRVLEGGRRGGRQVLADELEEGLLRGDEPAHADLGAGDHQEVGGRVDDGLGARHEVEGLGELVVLERVGALRRERAGGGLLLVALRAGDPARDQERRGEGEGQRRTPQDTARTARRSS
ncbi:MAG: hypothetical protein QM820_41310 [Minicystis sp.]